MDEQSEFFRAKITFDPTMDERYGPGPLFPHKIERIMQLVKGTVLDPAVKAKAAEESQKPTPA